MAMRDTLDTILEGISEAVLTDKEWILADSILNGSTSLLSQYQALSRVIYGRNGLSDSIDLLKAYFREEGLSESELSQDTPAYSNIIIGGVLE